MERAPAASMVSFVVAALLGAVGQLLYKSGADRTTSSIASYLLNWRLAAGVACYGLVMTLFVAGFKRGGSLAVLYPLYASTFIWGALLSHFIYGTDLKGVHFAGMALLVGGMYLMGR